MPAPPISAVCYSACTPGKGFLGASHSALGAVPVPSRRVLYQLLLFSFYMFSTPLSVPIQAEIWCQSKSAFVFAMTNHMLALRMLNHDFEEDPNLPNLTGAGGMVYQEASPPKDPTMLSKFSRVMESFKAQISQEDTDRFKVTTFNDLKSVVQDIQAEQARRKSLRNMTKIRPYLDGLNQYSAVIEVFVNSKPDILAFIWVSWLRMHRQPDNAL